MVPPLPRSYVMKEILRIQSRVADISERFRNINYRKEGEQTLYETETIGWWLRLEGSHEANFVGHSKPEGIEKGDVVWLILAKPNKEPPR